MTEILSDSSPERLSTAVKASLQALFRRTRLAPQTDWYDSGKLVRWRTSVPHPWFNGVIAQEPPGRDEAATIRETVAYFGASSVQAFSWWLEPHLESGDWADLLEAEGFRCSNDTPGMAADLQELPASVPHPPDLVVRRVDDLETFRIWTRIFVRGYGLPDDAEDAIFDLLSGMGLDHPLQYYLGSLGDRPVVTSTLFLAAGVAGIYNVATVPEARRQGLGAELTLLPLKEAREMGYRIGILQSSTSGFGVYRRLGFEQVCTLDHFYRREG